MNTCVLKVFKWSMTEPLLCGKTGTTPTLRLSVRHCLDSKETCFKWSVWIKAPTQEISAEKSWVWRQVATSVPKTHNWDGLKWSISSLQHSPPMGEAPYHSRLTGYSSLLPRELFKRVPHNLPWEAGGAFLWSVLAQEPESVWVLIDRSTRVIGATFRENGDSWRTGW